MHESDDFCQQGCLRPSAFDGCIHLCAGMLLVLDGDGTVVSINHGGAELIGCPADEIVGSNWFASYVVESLRDAVQAEFSRVAREEGTAASYYEYRLRRATGEELTIACHNKPLATFDDRGIGGVFSSGMDVTKRIRETNALRENEQRLLAILNTAVDGIVTIDEYGVVESFNPACEHMFGYQAREVIGRNVSLLMPEPDSSRHDEYLQNYRDTGCKRIIGIGREVLGQRKDGSTFPLEIAVSETLLPAKRQIFTGVLKDVSKRREAEEELRRANEQLMVQTMFTQRLSALAAMAGGIAHELNQPLSGIRVYSQTLQSYLEEAQLLSRDMLEPILARIIAQVDRAARIVEHMREFASESRQSNASVVDLRELIEDVLELVGQQLRNHNIDFRNEVLPNTLVLADGHRVEQVLINLISNAKDSILDKPQRNGRMDTIRMWVSRGETVALSISDTGGGIPDNVRDSLFEPFVTTKGPQRGTGLGLATCHGILQDYNAQIELVETSASGTTFKINFRGA